MKAELPSYPDTEKKSGNFETIQVKDFDQESAKSFFESMEQVRENKQGFVPVYIDSYGGYIHSLLSMIDCIKACPVPVATISSGVAMSCGSILLAMGTPGWRYSAPNTTVMVHSVASMAMGKVGDLEIGVKESLRLQKLVFNLMAKNCGHDKNFFLDWLAEQQDRDIFLTSKQAKKLLIVDHVGLPHIAKEEKEIIRTLTL